MAFQIEEVPQAQTDAQDGRRAAGFTLIEIMAVVIIMGLLMGIVGVTVFGRVDEARVQTTRMQIKQVENALEFFRICLLYTSPSPRDTR